MCRSKSEGGQRCDAHMSQERREANRAYQRKRYHERKAIMERVLETEPSMSKEDAEEYARHAMRIDSRLKKAQKAGLDTEQDYTYKAPDGSMRWLPGRERLHEQIISQLLDQYDDVPRERQALMSGGLGGAGKGYVLANYSPYDTSNYATVNPDDIKEIMADMGMIPEVEGLSPMEASPLAHEEASYLSKVLASALMNRGTNIIYDITMSSDPSTRKKLGQLEASGYSVDAIFVDIDPDESVRRAQKRHLSGYLRYRDGVGQGGRWLPPEVTEAQKIQSSPKLHRSVNAQVYENLANAGAFRHYHVYDNNVTGREPEHLDSVRNDDGWD